MPSKVRVPGRRGCDIAACSPISTCNLIPGALEAHVARQCTCSCPAPTLHVVMPRPLPQEPSGSEVSPLAASALATDGPWGTSGNGHASGTSDPASTGGSPSTRKPTAADNASGADLPPRGLPEWPMLRAEDGGRDVHHLHVALHRKGYECHSDDVQWWQYGDSTYNAVQVFQVRSDPAWAPLRSRGWRCWAVGGGVPRLAAAS